MSVIDVNQLEGRTGQIICLICQDNVEIRVWKEGKKWPYESCRISMLSPSLLCVFVSFFKGFYRWSMFLLKYYDCDCLSDYKSYTRYFATFFGLNTENCQMFYVINIFKSFIISMTNKSERKILINPIAAYLL